MALTFQQLQTLLTPDNAQKLAVAATALETATLTKLWQTVLADGTLTLNGATMTADEPNQTITVTGQLAADGFPGLQQAQLTSGVFRLLTDGTVTAVLTLAVNDDKWKLSASFPVLADGLVDQWLLTNAILTLDSTDTTGLPADFRSSFGYSADLPAVAEALVPGLTLAASVDLAKGAGASVPLKTILDQVVKLPVAMSGPLVIYPFPGDGEGAGPMLYPELWLRPANDQGTRTLTFGTNTITFGPQMAVVLQEAASPTPPELAVLPSPIVALRCTYQPAGNWQPIPVGAFYYDADSPLLELSVGNPVAQAGTVDQLTALLNGADGVATLLAPGYNFPGVSVVALDTATLVFNTEPVGLEQVLVVFGIGQQSDWSLFNGLVKINGIQISMGATKTDDGWQATAGVLATATFADNAAALSASLTLPDLYFRVALETGEKLDLTSAVTSLIGTSSINMSSFTGASFELTGNVKNNAYTFTADLEGEWPLAGPLVLQEILLELGTDSQSTHGSVTGTLGLGGAQLVVSAGYDSKGGWVFTGEVLPGEAKPNLTALLADLAGAFGFTPPDGLPEIDLDDLRIEYDYLSGSGSTMMVDAVLSFPGATIDLTALPLIGEHLSPEDSISLDTVTLHLDTDGPCTMTIGLTLAGKPENLLLTFGNSNNAQTLKLLPAYTASRALAVTASPPGTTANSPAGTWLNVQRTIGPVTVEKIGFNLSKGGLQVMVNASLSFTAFNAEVMGLGVTVPLKSPYIPSFNIDGLSINYSTSALTIAGAFLKTDKKEYLEFSGQLMVRAGNFALSALGSYATTSPPSLFAFVMVNAPIGGPPYFYINGLAGGFGYNRNLLLPPIDQVASYPLVAGSSAGANNPFNKQPPVKVMDQYLGVQMGENWLAAGLSVASFGMVQASMLLSVAFGNRLQVGLLGLGTLSVPAKATTPVVYVELALEAIFAPDEGELSVFAQLTSNSYVFEKDCRLTGGFAFCLWFSPSPFEGDFVITLGGYNPHFTPPAHYPSVPRLGMNWQVGSALVIKGGTYFALTPHAVMAGGSLEAAWQSGPLSASFKVWADFLIYWKPFHYDIRLGVSFSVVASLKVAFVRITLSVSLGAQLHLWGPSFKYRALIDLDIISFTIGDDDSDDKLPAIDWDDFKTSFLGTDTKTEALPAALLLGLGTDASCQEAAAAPPPAANTVVNLVVADGVLQDLTKSGVMVSGCGAPARPLDYLVDPQHFALRTQTQIPAKALIYNGDQQPGSWATDFGVGPMQVTRENLTVSEHTVRVCYLTTCEPYDRLAPAPVIGPAPKGMWLYEADLSSGLNDHAQLTNLLQGIELTPRIQEGGKTQPVLVEALLYDTEGTRNVRWGTNPAPTTDPFGKDDPLRKLADTIGDPAVTATRAALLADLFYQGFEMPTALNPTPMMTEARLELLDPYVLSYLGEAKTY